MQDQRSNLKNQRHKSKIKSEGSEDFKRRLYELVIEVLKFLNSIPRGQVVNPIVDQLVRSVTSIIANYVEAKAASSRKDYINFFNHALKSANETKVWLAIIRDLNVGDRKVINDFINEVSEIANILASSIITLKGRRA